MAYRILYGNSPGRPVDFGRILRIQTLISAGILGAVLLVTMFWDAGGALLRDYLLTGDGRLDVAAANLGAAWAAGEGWYDALTALCRGVIYGPV